MLPSLKMQGKYKPFWTPDLSKEDGDIPTTWEAWMAAIRRPRRWICGLTIKAAATRLGVKVIVVLKSDDGSWGSPSAFGNVNKKKKEMPVVVGLDESAGHYVLLVPDSVGSIPGSWLSAGEADAFIHVAKLFARCWIN